jgi:DNA-binding MarR family transcriptional regulator
VNSNVSRQLNTHRLPAVFTPRQGQYLAFIYYYEKINRRPPAEADIQHYFNVSAPAVHQMVLALEAGGNIERTAGKSRSIRVLVPPGALPQLE